MCQQFFSIGGLVADVVGFLLIAWEWREVFEHNVLRRENAVEDAYIRMTEGEDVAGEREKARASMWRNTQTENIKDNKRRARIFYTGVALVVVGFVGQLIGSLPFAISHLGFKSCS
jgi:hypothetical protein